MLKYAYSTSFPIIFSEAKIVVSFTPATAILFLLDLLDSGLFLICYYPLLPLW